MQAVLLVTGQLPEVVKKDIDPSAKRPELLLKSSFQNISYDVATARAKQLVQSRVQGVYHWKSITLMRAASFVFVDSITFVPADLSKSQLLFARRTDEDDLTGFVHPIDVEEGKYGDDIVVVTVETLDAATKGIDAQIIQGIRFILEAFLNDRHTRAIGLNFRHLQEKVTRIWAKAVAQ
jgi:hypothetical protein